MAFNPNELLYKEWLITNKRGTYAMMGASGALHSKAHSLLACIDSNSLKPFNMVSKVEEMIEVDGTRSPLSTNFYSLDTIHPNGYENITKFNSDEVIETNYKIDDLKIKKSITLDEYENMVVIKYEIDSPAKGSLEVAPIIASRYTDAIFRKEEIDWTVDRKAFEEGEILEISNAPFKLMIAGEGAKYQQSDKWYYYFRYDYDVQLGSRGREDLYNPGILVFNMPRKGQYTFTVSFIAHNEKKEMSRLWDKVKENSEEIFNSRKTREKELIKQYYSSVENKCEEINLVVKNSDAFIYRNNIGTSMITGFYGGNAGNFREIMLSIPGILLTTKRYEEAKSLLHTMASYVKDGVPPKNIINGGITADNGFWFAYALYKYAKETNDKETVASLMPVIVKIGESYLNGFADRVSVDKTMMIKICEGKEALTWMDGEVNGEATTPRLGKPVEINALWFNYLKFGEFFDSILGVKSELYQKKSKFTFKQISRKVGSRFGREFWNRRANFLYDYVDKNEKVEVSRGNQAFVIGLPFGVLEASREKKLLKLIEEDLLTPVGISTITAKSAQYVETLPNDLAGRAIAYYQGTIWPILFDFYIQGYLRVFGNSQKVKDKLRKQFEELLARYDERFYGFYPQMYTTIKDGNETYYAPEGLQASALSSAAVLSIYKSLN